MEDLDKKLDKIDQEYEKERKEKPEKEEKPKKEEKKKEPKKEEYETVTVTKKPVKEGSYFDGGLFELIGYRILGFLITIFTFGIARSWAICMIIRYKVNHTVLNGKRLAFEGKGSDLFVQRLKWLLLSIITFGIYLIFKPVKMLQWEVSHIHFEDEDYIAGDSFFDAGVIKLVGINILCGLINLFTLGICYPITECMKIKWIVKHSIINKKKLLFTGSGVKLFLYRMLWGFLSIITFGIFGLWIGIKHLKFYVKNTRIKKVGEEIKSDPTDLVVLLVFLVVGAFFAFIVAMTALKFTRTEYDSNNSSVDVVTEIDNALDAGSSEVISLMKQRNDVSAGARDYVDTLSSMSDITNKGLKGNYSYSTTTFINGFSYDLSFYVAYKGYYCEKYYADGNKNSIECFKINEDNGETDFFKKPLYKYFHTITDSITKKESWYSVN